MAEFADTRRRLLAAASASSSATTDLVEASRGDRLRWPDAQETLTALVDAVRLTLEAIETNRTGTEVEVNADYVAGMVKKIAEGD